MASLRGFEPPACRLGGGRSVQLSYSDSPAILAPRGHHFHKQQKTSETIRGERSVVGTAGFEPATSWSRTRRTTKLCYVPMRLRAK